MKNLIAKINDWNAPRNREEFISLLRRSQQKNIFNESTLTMLENVLQINEMQARDIMIPRAQVILLNTEQTVEELLPIVINSSHSRLPVTGDNPDEIIGILLVKDLIYSLWKKPAQFTLRDILRPVFFIPESKHLDTLLQEFRLNHQHMAIIVDEYGGMAGLLTIEDILEQIVGDIEDEHDLDDENYIKRYSDTLFSVKAITPIKEFNDYFETHFSDEEADTVGGIVLKAFGHLPKRGEHVLIDAFRFNVLHADNRRIRLLRVKKNIV